MEWASSSLKHSMPSTHGSQSPHTLYSSPSPQPSYMLPFTASSAFSPGEQVYAHVFVPGLQLSGWVEAVVVEKEGMPGTIAVDGKPTNTMFYKVCFGSNRLTDFVSPNHGSVIAKTDATKAAITADNGHWIKGI